jgi:hypothetical protein
VANVKRCGLPKPDQDLNPTGAATMKRCLRSAAIALRDSSAAFLITFSPAHEQVHHASNSGDRRITDRFEWSSVLESLVRQAGGPASGRGKGRQRRG